MPELPEVETIKRDLQKVAGRKIIQVEVLDPRAIKGIPAGAFQRGLEGDTFQKVDRRGKFLIFKLKSGQCFLAHLGMAGWFEYTKDKKLEYVRLIFTLNNGWRLYFFDKRLFGGVGPLSDQLKGLGPEPLSKDFTLKLFGKLLSGRKTKIKPLLLEQGLIAGIGNIYAQEALFRAGIHPERKADTLKPEEIKKLHEAIRAVLKSAVAARGTSVDAYVDASGKKGRFQYQLQVYGREGEPCRRCKSPLRRKVIGQRGTCFCPHCQR